jgi:ABC-type uncharacterized transport system permease subunit
MSPVSDFSRRVVFFLFVLSSALLLSVLVIFLAGRSPGLFFFLLYSGSIGDKEVFLLSLIKMTPLILTGLSVAFALRGGLFNIGAEGQLYLGAIACALVGGLAPLPPPIHLPFVLSISFIAGGLLGFLVGWLKAKRGAHEVITTIMLNYIVIHLTTYLVREPFSAGEAIPKTKEIAVSAELPIIARAGSAELSLGIIIAFSLVFFTFLLLFKTPFGYEVRAIGGNIKAAERGGIKAGKNIMWLMAFSGGLAGLAGGIEVAGLHHTFYGQFSPGYGFDGIAVALLAANHPLIVPFSAFFFSSLRTADRVIQLEGGIPRDIVLVIQAVVIIVVCGRNWPVIRRFIRRTDQ